VDNGKFIDDLKGLTKKETYLLLKQMKTCGLSLMQKTLDKITYLVNDSFYTEKGGNFEVMMFFAMDQIYWLEKILC
jgi:hypothetical protein